MDANLALKDTEQNVGEAAAEARSERAQMTAGASVKLAEAKSTMDQRGKEIDADMAETDADLA